MLSIKLLDKNLKSDAFNMDKTSEYKMGLANLLLVIINSSILIHIVLFTCSHNGCWLDLKSSRVWLLNIFWFVENSDKIKEKIEKKNHLKFKKRFHFDWIMRICFVQNICLHYITNASKTHVGMVFFYSDSSLLVSVDSHFVQNIVFNQIALFPRYIFRVNMQNLLIQRM